MELKRLDLTWSGEVDLTAATPRSRLGLVYFEAWMQLDAVCMLGCVRVAMCAQNATAHVVYLAFMLVTLLLRRSYRSHYTVGSSPGCDVNVEWPSTTCELIVGRLPTGCLQLLTCFYHLHHCRDLLARSRTSHLMPDKWPLHPQAPAPKIVNILRS